MNSLLGYVGEDQAFDVRQIIAAIRTIPGISNPREDVSPEIFECEYEAMGGRTIVRITSDARSVSADREGDASVKFMLELQSRLKIDLYVIDTNYTFDLPVRSFPTVEEFRRAASAGLRLAPWD